MAGEKYIVATLENAFHIAIRNILNPSGYLFLANCSDSISLIRLVRSYSPDFIVVDGTMRTQEFKPTIETIDDEMLCACIVVGSYHDLQMEYPLDKSNVISYCPKPLNKELLVHTVDLSMLAQKRIFNMSRRLKEMTENYETRKVVERAKWILMERDGINETDAYERMRRKSMDSRMPMKSIAEAIIFTHELSGR